MWYLMKILILCYMRKTISGRIYVGVDKKNS